MLRTERNPFAGGGTTDCFPSSDPSLGDRARPQDTGLEGLDERYMPFARLLWFRTVQDNQVFKKGVKFLPWGLFGAVMVLRFALSSPAMVIGACLLGVVFLATRRLCTLKQMMDKVGPRRYFRWVAGLIVGGVLWVSQANPVFAQFFQAAEDFFTTTFPDAGTVVPVIFGVLRAIFLIYIGVALVRVVQAGRNDDDWQQMARQPVIIVMAVVLGDVLATLVIGGAGA